MEKAIREHRNAAKEDKVIENTIKNYVENKQRILFSVKCVDGEAIFEGLKGVVDEVIENKEVYNFLKQAISKTRSKDEEFEYMTTKNQGLPWLKAPLDLINEHHQWTDIEVKQTVKIYLTEIGWKKSHGKPVWWPSNWDFLKYVNWSSTSMYHNKLILKAILEYKNIDPENHCFHPSIQEKQRKNKKPKETVLNISNSEGNISDSEGVPEDDYREEGDAEEEDVIKNNADHENKGDSDMEVNSHGDSEDDSDLNNSHSEDKNKRKRPLSPARRISKNKASKNEAKRSSFASAQPPPKRKIYQCIHCDLKFKSQVKRTEHYEINRYSCGSQISSSTLHD